MGRRDKRRKSATEILPYPPPFSRDGFQSRTLEEFVLNDEFMDYHHRCIVKQLQDNGRDYLSFFAMICHLGRVVEFNLSNLRPFEDEAMNQSLSAEKIRRAIQIIVAAAADKSLGPDTPRDEWGVLAFTADFSKQYAEDHGFLKTIEQEIETIETVELIKFIMLIKTALDLPT